MSITDFKLVTGSDPAAGADWSVTVPAGETWKLVAVRADFVTSATVANRFARLSIDDGTTEFLLSFCAGTLVASTTYPCYWFAGAPSTTGAAGTSAPIPAGLILLPGYRVKSSTLSIQAGDNWGTPVLYLRLPGSIR